MGAWLVFFIFADYAIISYTILFQFSEVKAVNIKAAIQPFTSITARQ